LQVLRSMQRGQHALHVKAELGRLRAALRM
jgi:hypothetical protein